MSNSLFETENVKQYINDLFNKQKDTKAISYTLYIELCKFIEKIKVFEVVGKKETLKNILVHIVCSEKYTSDEKKERIIMLIDSLKKKDKSNEKKIEEMKNNLLLELEKNNTNKQKCKTDIDKILVSYFNSFSIKSENNTINEEMKLKIKNSSKEDRELFLNFFNYVKCEDVECEKYKIVTSDTDNSKLNLIKNDKKIKLFELFTGKDVQLIISQEEDNEINKKKPFLKRKLDEIIDSVVELLSKKGFIVNDKELMKGGGKGEIKKWIKKKLEEMKLLKNDELTTLGFITFSGALLASGATLFLYNFLKQNENVDFTPPPPPIPGGNIIGGGIKCFLIPDLKLNLVDKLLTEEEYESKISDFGFKECDNANIINLENKKYLLEGEKQNIPNDFEENFLKQKEQKINCLTETNLFRRIKAPFVKDVWKNLNKKLNTPNIINTPNILQILKESKFDINDINMVGGNPEETNNIFIKTVNRETELSYSNEIINILKRALTKLNSNGIFLDDRTIKELEMNIQSFKNLEKELSIIAKKIMDCINISSFNNGNGKILNEQELNKYIEEHKILLEKQNNMGNDLTKALIKLIDLADC